MAELELYYDPALKDKVGDSVSFGIVKAGVRTRKDIYLKNLIKYGMKVNITLKADDVEIMKQVDVIPAKGVAKVTFDIEPKITRMNPIDGSLIVKYEYVVR